MITRLQDTGYIESQEHQGEIPAYLDRPALLVYSGSFRSMDGPVDVTPEHLDLMASTYNSTLEKFKRLASGGLPIRMAPPVQLDHSTSSKDTVGRVIGTLQVKDHVLDDGSQVKALVTDKMRILGRENVEKVLDGRWVHLSMGADFDKGQFSELTITPFPAAEDARMLSKSRGESVMKKLIELLKAKFKLSDDEAKKKAEGMTDDEKAGLESEGVHIDIGSHQGEGGTEMEDPVQKKKTAYLEALRKKKLDEMKAKHASELEEMKTRSLDSLEEMSNAEKLPEALADTGAQGGEAPPPAVNKGDEKLEEDPAKKAFEEMSNSAEMPEALKAKMKEALGCWPKAKTSSMVAKPEIDKLVKDMTAQIEETKSKLTRARLNARLTSLKASAKITPAEVKKIDMDRLSKESEVTQNAVLKTYEDREPVIFIGYLSSQKAESVADMQKRAELSALEEETRSHMKSLPKGRKMSNADDVPEALSLFGDYEKDFDQLCHLIDSGAKEDAKKHLKALLSEVRAGRYKGIEVGEDGEKQMSAISDSVKLMETQLGNLVKMVK